MIEQYIREKDLCVKRKFQYIGCPNKKWNARFFLLWNSKLSHSLISSDKTLSSEKNDTKTIWFGSVVLILQPFLETYSHLRIFLIRRELFMADIAVHKLSLCFVCTDQWTSGLLNVWKSDKPLSLTEMSREWRETWQWLCLRNDHRINTTQPISMFLVPFFSEDNVLSDEIKICYIYFRISK